MPIVGPYRALSASCAVARCTASPVRMKRSRGAASIRALVLRSKASVTGIKFHNPASVWSEKRRARSAACLGVDAPSRTRRWSMAWNSAKAHSEEEMVSALRTNARTGKIPVH